MHGSQRRCLLRHFEGQVLWFPRGIGDFEVVGLHGTASIRNAEVYCVGLGLYPGGFLWRGLFALFDGH